MIDSLESTFVHKIFKNRFTSHLWSGQREEFGHNYSNSGGVWAHKFGPIETPVAQTPVYTINLHTIMWAHIENTRSNSPHTKKFTNLLLKENKLCAVCSLLNKSQNYCMQMKSRLKNSSFKFHVRLLLLVKSLCFGMCGKIERKNQQNERRWVVDVMLLVKSKTMKHSMNRSLSCAFNRFLKTLFYSRHGKEEEEVCRRKITLCFSV